MTEFIRVEALRSEVLGMAPGFSVVDLEDLTVEVLGKNVYQIGLVSTEIIRVEALGQMPAMKAAAVEGVRVEILGYWPSS